VLVKILRSLSHPWYIRQSSVYSSFFVSSWWHEVCVCVCVCLCVCVCVCVCANTLMQRMTAWCEYYINVKLARKNRNWISERNAESTNNSRPSACIYPSLKYTQWVS
jgi:hypothetical protein